MKKQAEILEAIKRHIKEQIESALELPEYYYETENWVKGYLYAFFHSGIINQEQYNHYFGWFLRESGTVILVEGKYSDINEPAVDEEPAEDEEPYPEFERSGVSVYEYATGFRKYPEVVVTCENGFLPTGQIRYNVEVLCIQENKYYVHYTSKDETQAIEKARYYYGAYFLRMDDDCG